MIKDRSPFSGNYNFLALSGVSFCALKLFVPRIPCLRDRFFIKIRSFKHPKIINVVGEIGLQFEGGSDRAASVY